MKMNMKILVVCGILLQVSQHALAAVVEVYEGAESVLIPCVYKGQMPPEPLVKWTRNDLNPTSVHLRQVKGKEEKKEGDDFTDQNPAYRGRTSMDPDALHSADFSLTVRKPRLSDSGNYICTISDGIAEVKVTEVHLKVKGQQEKKELKVEKGTKSILLPCTTTPDLSEDTTVEWTRSDPVFMFVHVFAKTSKHSKDKDDQYCGRTKMSQDLLRTGNLNLTLDHLRDEDDGSYICTIYRDQDILRQEVVLTYVEPGLSPWVKAVLVLLGLLLVILSVYFMFKLYFKPVYQVEVESGVKSVLLTCRTTAGLFKDTKVEWTDRDKKKVHVFENGSDQLKEQDQDYRNRTEMKKSLLRPGDLSLTLKHPTDRDSQTFTCRVNNKEGTILMETQVDLWVKVLQVEVDSGVKSVLLSCRTTDHLPEDAKVVWTDEDNYLVHVFENGSDQPEEQDQFYRNRTEMKKSLLRPGDLSLTLKHPTYRDSQIFTCRVYNKQGHMLMLKQVDLKVKVPQVVEVESGVESVLLPCRTTDHLPEVYKVEWTDRYYMKVHVFEKGSDPPKEQHWLYNNRTEMNKDLLTTGDLSLTLKHPTVLNSQIYTCRVYNKEGKILMMKRVDLKVKVLQVEVESGVKSVLLSCRTTGPLPDDTKVEWTDELDSKVHVFEKGSDPPGAQHWLYNNKTEMNKNLLRTGDLSLTLKHPTFNQVFTCRVYNKEGKILMEKQVDLKVKVRFHTPPPLWRAHVQDPPSSVIFQVQDPPSAVRFHTPPLPRRVQVQEDMRTRSDSTDPTPLLADESV